MVSLFDLRQRENTSATKIMVRKWIVNSSMDNKMDCRGKKKEPNVPHY